MSYKVEELPVSATVLGKGPYWDIETQNFYFVDILGPTLFRYSYSENKVYQSKLIGEKYAGFIIPIEGQKDQFAVGCGRRVVVVQWDGKAPECSVVRSIFSVLDDSKYESVRFNEGKCDPRGRFYGGTVVQGDDHSGRLNELFRFDNGTVTSLKKNIAVSNGLAWNEKTKKFYYVDTFDFNIKEYDYDINSGKIENEKILLSLRSETSDDHGWPDSMTIDNQGFLYVAVFNRYAVYKVDPNTGKIVEEYKLPPKQITSCSFGGPNLDILFVTTSSLFGEPEPAGRIYKITGIGAKGLPENKMRI